MSGVVAHHDTRLVSTKVGDTHREREKGTGGDLVLVFLGLEGHDLVLAERDELERREPVRGLVDLSTIAERENRRR
jgi:hypothetical protein